MEEEEDESVNSGKFARSVVEQVNRSDIDAMVQVQRDMLSRYEKTNEMLINFNMLSLSRFEATSQEFKQHTQVLYEMKKDLDNVFRRIRVMKQRLSTLYPEAFSVCSDVYNVISEDEDNGTIDKATKTENPVNQNCVNNRKVSTQSMDGMNDQIKNLDEQKEEINCDKMSKGDSVVNHISQSDLTKTSDVLNSEWLPTDNG